MPVGSSEIVMPGWRWPPCQLGEQPEHRGRRVGPPMAVVPARLASV